MTISFGTAQTNGLPLLVTAITQGTRQLLHTFPAGSATPNMVTLYAWNLTAAPATLHIDIEDSGGTVLRELTVGVPVGSGLFKVLSADNTEDVALIQNGGNTIKVWADIASALGVSAGVDNQDTGQVITFGSGQTNGLPLLVTSITQGTRQLLHTFTSAAKPEIVEIKAMNFDGSPAVLHIDIEDSGGTILRELTVAIPVGSGLFKVLGVDSREDVALIQNGASTVKVWSDTASVLGVSASVNTQITHTGPAAPDLKTAYGYGLLAGTTITNTGATTDTGNLGLTPGSSVTGAPTVLGATNIDNPAAIQAQADLTAAYLDAQGRAGGTVVSGDIGGTSPAPGVYKSTSSLAVTTADLTLDAAGDPTAVWIFQIATTFLLSAGKSIVLANGAQAKNVFFAVGSSATLNAASHLRGTIMALTSITEVTGGLVDGRLLAQNGAITLDTNTITVPA